MNIQALTDVSEIRRRARERVKRGNVPRNNQNGSESTITLLNEALATELVCVLRYRQHYYVARGINSEPIAAEFLEHANQEMEHADKLAARIVQLGGTPDLNPDGLSERSHSEYVQSSSLDAMIQENLVAELVAIDTYKELITCVGNDDPTTRRLFEEILAVEEEHAEELSSLLEGK